MPLIKKIDLYVLKKFLMLFVGSFFVVLFVLMMQFLWRYLDELIGKGLSFKILGQFFWHASITLVPMGLPLSILLASLISFGNMGEQLELTALKSAGIPLRRIMAPVGIFCAALGIYSLYFQNSIMPNAQKELTRLVVTMKETSPAIEIPEGMFYSGIPDVNIYVDHKNAKTGMLYKVIIYKVDQGIQNAQIVVADSAQLETTADKHFLRLAIFSGEQFENLQQGGGNKLMKGAQVPYDRETFKEKVILIPFDSDFNLMDAELFSGVAKVKNLRELRKGADSIRRTCDSIGRNFYLSLEARYLQAGYLQSKDSAMALKRAEQASSNIDTLWNNLKAEKKVSILESSGQTVHSALTDLEFEKPVTQDGYKNMRRHLIEWHKKFAVALSCIIFFFIGAPLGAIIRKGGLGLPTVVSVLIFIIYYIIDTSGMKLARDGNVTVTYGMWISTMVLVPLGTFITIKANSDSSVFNMDAIKIKLSRFFGIRQKRNLMKKEVIIESPHYEEELLHVKELTKACQACIDAERLPHAPNYFRLFFRNDQADGISHLKESLEAMIERLWNTDDLYLLDAMNKYPEIYTLSHKIMGPHWAKVAQGAILPIGLLMWIRAWRFRIRLYNDLRQVMKTNAKVAEQLQKLISKT